MVSGNFNESESVAPASFGIGVGATVGTSYQPAQVGLKSPRSESLADRGPVGHRFPRRVIRPNSPLVMPRSPVMG